MDIIIILDMEFAVLPQNKNVQNFQTENTLKRCFNWKIISTKLRKSYRCKFRVLYSNICSISHIYFCKRGICTTLNNVSMEDNNVNCVWRIYSELILISNIIRKKCLCDMVISKLIRVSSTSSEGNRRHTLIVGTSLLGA